MLSNACKPDYEYIQPVNSKTDCLGTKMIEPRFSNARIAAS